MQRNNISSVGKKSMNEKEKRNNSEPCVCWPKTEQTNSCNIIRQNAIKRTKLNSSKSNEYKVQTSILLHVRVSIGDICIQQYPLNTFLICTTFFVGFRFVSFRFDSLRRFLSVSFCKHECFYPISGCSIVQCSFHFVCVQMREHVACVFLACMYMSATFSHLSYQ